MRDMGWIKAPKEKNSNRYILAVIIIIQKKPKMLKDPMDIFLKAKQ